MRVVSWESSASGSTGAGAPANPSLFCWREWGLVSAQASRGGGAAAERVDVVREVVALVLVHDREHRHELAVDPHHAAVVAQGAVRVDDHRPISPVFVSLISSVCEWYIHITDGPSCS